ncbi:MAG: NADH-quinone oxidoreductase subunit J [Acidobacteriota bacterium]|jgi:NADH-quinone oxidoreductase subunit J
MTMGAVLFYAFSAVMLGSAVMVITRRNLVHSAVFLVLTFLAMAGLFVMMQAEFVAAVQVLVYAGGIIVLFLFVIMLVNMRIDWRPSRSWQMYLGAAVAALLVLLMLSTAVGWRAGPAAPTDAFRASGGNMQAVGDLLYRDYLLPFELASVLLLVAMVGAVLLALRRE